MLFFSYLYFQFFHASSIYSYKPLELSSVRASRNVDRGPALDTFRYRTYSLPPLRALFLAGDPPPAFFKYLGEHDFFTIPASATTRR